MEVETETVAKPHTEVKETETDKAPKTIKSGTKAGRKNLPTFSQTIVNLLRKQLILNQNMDRLKQLRQ